jgi:predicted HTH transcriptional regulator
MNLGSTEAHQRLVHLILITFGSNPKLRIWKQATGVAQQQGRFISFGLKGSADITGILANGKRIEIECKSGNARQSKEQLNFQKIVERFNGIYIVVRSIEDAHDQLQKIFAECV